MLLGLKTLSLVVPKQSQKKRMDQVLKGQSDLEVDLEVERGSGQTRIMAGGSKISQNKGSIDLPV